MNALIYLNGPFIGFIVASIGMRFVYPSVSMEGRAFWAVKSSPVSPKRVLVIKVLFYLLPMTILGMILCTVTNAIFTVSTPVLRWLSYFNVLLITTVITSLAIGVGSVNADFNADSPLKIALAQAISFEDAQLEFTQNVYKAFPIGKVLAYNKKTGGQRHLFSYFLYLLIPTFCDAFFAILTSCT